MRRFHWLPWLSSSAVVVGTSLLLSPSLVKAEALDEAKVKGMLMQRFDENRNDKLDSGEARQARARLKNLLEDKSEREINIQTWRDDVRELLQSLDSDSDNRLSVAERDAGRELLDRLIPAVDASAPKERETPSTSTPKKEKNKDNDGERPRRAGQNSRGSLGGYAMGGGGFGMIVPGNMNGNNWQNGMNSNWNSGTMSSTSGGASGGMTGSSASSDMGSMASGSGDMGSMASGSGDMGSMASGSGDMGTAGGDMSDLMRPKKGDPGNLPPPRPDGLGGGMAPPVVGAPPTGPNGASTVPFNPMPNF